MLKKIMDSFGKSYSWPDRFPLIAKNLLEVRSLNHLKIAMGWKINPILEGDHLHIFQYLEDLNDRRLRDAEVIGAACCNDAPHCLLEIGTANGRTTALMALNARSGIVHTVNIPPDEIREGGANVTFAPPLEEIGIYYRNMGLANISQILANTAHWEPDFGPIDVAFIDGCHDADFVYNDTRKVLKKCRPGSIVMWHDFNPGLANAYGWINEVCSGVNRLYSDHLIRGRILLLQDSWVGLYRVPKE